MYKIEKRNNIYYITFSGSITEEEMQKWYEESESLLKNASGTCFVIVDMRSMKPLSDKSQAILKKGQSAYKIKGMKRSAVILESTVLTMQLKRIGQETGIYAWERYIDASKDKDFLKTAEAWVEKEIDPDKK